MNWFPISLKPVDGQLCVVYDSYNADLKVWPARYSEACDCFFAGSHGAIGYFEYEEVTHWLPLPDKPEDL